MADDVEVKFTKAQVLSAQIVDAFARSGIPSPSDPSNPFHVRAKESEAMFTAAMAFLKRVPGPVGDLCAYAWDIFHHGHVRMAVGPDVPSLHLAIAGSPLSAQCLVFVPHEWPDMVRGEPLMQVGAVVFTASQAVDFHNGMFPPREPSSRIKERAASFEAEYLRMIPAESLNDYQREVLVKNPAGFHERFSYHRRPVIGKD